MSILVVSKNISCTFKVKANKVLDKKNAISQYESLFLQQCIENKNRLNYPPKINNEYTLSHHKLGNNTHD